MVKDVFMPTKRNKEGRKFAFVRFDPGSDIEEILSTVTGLWISNYKILANLARFDREVSRGTEMNNYVKEIKVRTRHREVGLSYLQATMVKKGS